MGGPVACGAQVESMPSRAHGHKGLLGLVAPGSESWGFEQLEALRDYLADDHAQHPNASPGSRRMAGLREDVTGLCRLLLDRVSAAGSVSPAVLRTVDLVLEVVLQLCGTPEVAYE